MSFYRVEFLIEVGDMDEQEIDDLVADSLRAQGAVIESSSVYEVRL